MTTSPSRTLSGRRVFCYFAVFFIIIIAMNIYMAVRATRTFSGTVVEHAYEKGLAYNAVVKAEEAQEKLGWKGGIVLSGGQLVFTLRDKKGAVLTPAVATAHITRPAQQGLDFEATLEHGKATVAFPEKGQWEVRVFATVGTQEYQQAARVVVK